MAVVENVGGYTRDGHMVEFMLADTNVVWRIICPVKSLEPGTEYDEAPWCHRLPESDDPEFKEVNDRCLIAEHVANASLTMNGHAYASFLEDYIGPEGVNAVLTINGRLEVGIRWSDDGTPEWVPWGVLSDEQPV